MTHATLTINLADLIPAGFVMFAPSASNPNKGYPIKMGHDGNLYCGCPAWKFQKKHPKDRTCKHLKAHTPAIIAKAMAKKAAA